MREPDVPEIGPQHLDAILRFLPVFEEPGFSFGEWHSAEGQMPYYSMGRETTDFLQALYEQQIVYSFDWTRWQDEAKKFVSDPELLKEADLLVLRKLLTTHLRKDRFVEGHLADMLECGHITAVLRRLQEIREEMGK
jgi:hypothetical protein